MQSSRKVLRDPCSSKMPAGQNEKMVGKDMDMEHKGNGWQSIKYYNVCIYA
jgi:hypothetical protein